MSDEEGVSRRGFFSAWAREIAEGLAEFVLPELEREAERLRGVFEQPPAVETVHPWRDLLQPADDEEPHPNGSEPEPSPEEGEGSED